MYAGTIEKIKESFFFHAHMNQDPPDELNDLPQEPQVADMYMCIYMGIHIWVYIWVYTYG
jgi:hypothetical protein